MKEANFGPYHIRKWFSFYEETLANETGILADGEPLKKYVLAVAIQNPFAGKFSEDLSSLIDHSPELGREFGRRINELAGDNEIVSYGKAILVGADGEYEHGNAFLTNPAADPIREALGGGKLGTQAMARALEQVGGFRFTDTSDDARGDVPTDSTD